MRLLGFEITRRRPPSGHEGVGAIRPGPRLVVHDYDAWPGGWQANASDAIYRRTPYLPITRFMPASRLIANDIGKLGRNLSSRTPRRASGAKSRTARTVRCLRRPNNYQNHIQSG